LFFLGGGEEVNPALPESNHKFMDTESTPVASKCLGKTQV